MSDEEIILMMYEALHSSFGVEVAVSDVETFKRRFYKARKAAIERGEDGLEPVSLRTCPTDPDGKVWITHGKAQTG